MKQFLYLSVFCVLAFTACTSDSFKRGDKGLEYKIISDGSGKKIEYGNFIQLHFTQRYKGAKDTILGDTRDYMPRINMFDSVTTPLEYYKILKQVRKGDSLVIRTRVDSFYKRTPNDIPTFMKKDDYILTCLKIVNIFVSREEADSANKAELALNGPRMFKNQMTQIEKEVIEKNTVQLQTDDKLITDFLAKNNIKAEKTKWGTYISTITEGTGELIDQSDIAVVNYTGRTLDSGHVFDSNVDPKFKRVEPLNVTISNVGTIILGWTDALTHMKSGSKATIYIPSTLAYGAEGREPEIHPNTNLVFDMEVLKVNKAQH